MLISVNSIFKINTTNTIYKKNLQFLTLAMEITNTPTLALVRIDCMSPMNFCLPNAFQCIITFGMEGSQYHFRKTLRKGRRENLLVNVTKQKLASIFMVFFVFLLIL